MKSGPVDPILGLTSAYANDKDANKVNLGVGAYRTNENHPLVFKCVRKAEKEIANDPKMFKVDILFDSRNMLQLTVLLITSQLPENSCSEQPQK
jgi:hypothetical protein